MKRETLALDTPARSATSSMVTRLRWAVEKSFINEPCCYRNALKPVSGEPISRKVVKRFYRLIGRYSDRRSKYLSDMTVGKKSDTTFNRTEAFH
jgi:hypothetical protein